VTPGSIDNEAFKTALTAELYHYAALTNGQKLTSIFFGGGTPSLMSPDTVAEIIELADTLWGLHSTCEITLEANPTSIETSKFRAFKRSGINRVSIGVQALNDADLLALGREHTAHEALKALEIAGAFFDRFSFDLIYARPDQGFAAWEDELALALTLGSEHISLYQLSIEPGTSFYRLGVQEADEDLGSELYQITQEITQDAGLPAYEISNHARPGCESRHNLTYWIGGDYVGVGPGAHGRITQQTSDHIPQKTTTLATYQIADPARWLNAVSTRGHGTAKTRPLAASERGMELLLSGLRLPQGVDLAQFRARSGLDISDALDPQGLDILSDAGLVVLTAESLSVSAAGRLTLNAILERLLA
jgi:oxygen-independent coproporphyrinogen-3 oxidase